MLSRGLALSSFPTVLLELLFVHFALNNILCRLCGMNHNGHNQSIFYRLLQLIMNLPALFEKRAACFLHVSRIEFCCSAICYIEKEILIGYDFRSVFSLENVLVQHFVYNFFVAAVEVFAAVYPRDFRSRRNPLNHLRLRERCRNSFEMMQMPISSEIEFFHKTSSC